jgi:class 3 adenylate cyclase/tetratricopeptide (TPR) repeat protein
MIEMRNLVPDFILEQYKQRQFHGALRAVSLFVDVSGFTATTETLMRHGTEGAEVLADTMLAIFTPLVQSVYAHGGLVAGFAGDALTALFPFTDGTATRRALAAASQIQQHMLANPRRTTRLGVFPFAVKLGLADGAAEWGILSAADQTRHAYYFRGEAIGGCARAEHLAARGDLVISARVRDALGPFVTVEPLADHWRVTDVVGAQTCAVAETSPDLGARAADAQAFFSPDLLHASVRGEFRQVVSVFINLQGNPGRAELVAFADPFFRLLAQYEGYLCRLDFGDKGCRALLFWGAPTSFEDDLERALDFVLDLRQATRIPLRAGVTYSIAYAGFAGAASREEYTCYSSRVNLAARLMSGAPWGAIWLDEPTAQRAHKRFELESAGAFAFKGLADQQTVHALKGHRAAVAPFYQFRLVGRQRELARLRDFVAPIFAGKFAGALVLVGEAGIGKSRLLHEFQSVIARSEATKQSPNWNQEIAAGKAPPRNDTAPVWFLCQCDQVLRQSLNPFRYFLRNYFDQSPALNDVERKVRFDAKLDALIARTPNAALQAELDRTRSFLGALVGLAWAGSLYEQLDPKLRFDNTLSALKTFLQAESLCQPVILQIEDLHWLDADSAEFLRRLTRNVGDYAFAILATSREQPAPNLFDADAPQQAFDPGALGVDDAQHLAEEILGGKVAAALAAWLVERTNGNPFFVEQLLLYMQEQGLLSEGKDGFIARAEGVMVPADVGVVLTARLDRLTQDVKHVVQTAAVLGREFQVQVLSQMLRDDAELSLKVKQAEAEAIWSALSEIRYIFKHALLRDAAYDMQLRARLRELHALAGQALERIYAADLAPHYADLAYHYGKTEDREQERRYARLAGEQAAAQFANAEAAHYLSRALELTPAEDAEMRYALVRARERVFELQAARQEQAQDLETLSALAEQLNDDARRAEAALRRGNYAEMSGDYPAAISALQQAVTWGRSAGVVETEAGGHVQWGRVLSRQADYAAAQAHLEQALALGLPKAQGPALLTLGNVAWYQGNYAGAQDYYAQALSLFRETGHRWGVCMATNNIGLVLLNQGDMQRANTYFQQAIILYREVGDRRGVGRPLISLGQIALNQGDFSQSQVYLDEALRLYRETGERLGEINALYTLGVVARGRADLAEAEVYLNQALWLCREIRDRRNESDSLLNLGIVRYLQRDYTTAQSHIRDALAIAEGVGAQPQRADALLNLGHILFDLGQLEQATTAYRQAIQIRRELDQVHLAMESVAGLARIALAQRDLAQALAHVETILGFLQTHNLDGTDDPLRVYLTCYQTLEASGDARALVFLRMACTQLQERASKIGDTVMRQQYLENLPTHREIANEWQKAVR